MRFWHFKSACIVFGMVVGFQARSQAQPVSVDALTVCEVVKQMSELEGKALAVVGRLSVRQEGHWLSTDSCDPSAAKPEILWLSLDEKNTPHLRTGWEVGGLVMRQKLAAARQSIKLASFPFGTQEYDRWAVVYGCIRPKSAVADQGKAMGTRKLAAGELLYGGDGYVLVVK